MTVTQILESARNNLNAVNDTLWSDSELLIKLYEAMLQMSRRTKCIEATDSSTVSVASTATYNVPTRSIEILRLNYSNRKLQRITEREVDQLVYNTSTPTTGTPIYYSLFADVVTMYPTPDASADVIKFWYYKEPAVPTSVSTLEIPTIGHDALVSGLTYKMMPKDLGHPLTVFWRDKWANDLDEIETFFKRRRVTDRFNRVTNEEGSLTTEFGII